MRDPGIRAGAGRAHPHPVVKLGGLTRLRWLLGALLMGSEGR